MELARYVVTGVCGISLGGILPGPEIDRMCFQCIEKQRGGIPSITNKNHSSRSLVAVPWGPAPEQMASEGLTLRAGSSVYPGRLEHADRRTKNHGTVG